MRAKLYKSVFAAPYRPRRDLTERGESTVGATIQDVARKAGVAVGTVSRAFNNYRDIRPETRLRIREAAEELGYRPNISARNLAGKNVPNIGLIFSGILEGDEKDACMPCDRLDGNLMERKIQALMDEGVNVINSYLYAAALRRHGIPHELHVFPKGPHGLGLAPDFPHVAQWAGLMKNWLIWMGWLK